MLTRKMKDSGVEWIGMIPESWNIVATKQKFKNKKEIVGAREPEFQRLALTLNGVIKKSKESSGGLQPEKFETYQILCKDELIFKLIDLENVKTSRVGYSYYTGLVSPVYIRLINPNESRYGYYYFLNLWNQKVFNYLGSGVRSNLTARDLLKVPYLQVPETEQNKIVAILDEKIERINNIISDTQQTIEELKKFKQSLITELVTMGLNKNIEMVDSKVEGIGRIPKHWTILRVKNVLSEKNEKSTTGTEEPLSMSQKFGLIPSRQMESIPYAPATYVGNKKVSVNDLVFNKLKAHLGVFAVSEYEGIVSPDYAVYYANKLCDAKYLEYLFKTPQLISEFIKYSRGVGAGLTRLYTHEFFNIKIALPSVEEQLEIVKKLNVKNKEISNLISEKQTLIKELEQYKKSLIYEYVTGKKEA